MRINFYTGTIDHQIITSSGGVQFVLSKISSALCKHGIKIKIVSCFPGDSPCPFQLDADIECSYLQSHLRHNSDASLISKIRFWILIFYKIKNILKDPSVDYHISVSPAISVIIILYSFLYKINVVIWENVQFHVYNKLVNLFRLFLFKYAYCIIVVSNSDLMYFIKNGVNSRLIYNPNSLNYRNQSNSDNILFSNKLVAAGRLSRQKGFDMLIDVAYILRKKYNADFKITIIGDGPQKNNLVEKVKLLDLESFIFFQPFTKDIAKAFKANSVFLLPSRFEGLPIVLLDSQAYGLPCIAFDCPTGPSEVIQNNVNGFLIDCFDIDDFATKIYELISNKEIFYKLSTNSIIKSRLFFLDDIIDQWLDLLKYDK